MISLNFRNVNMGFQLPSSPFSPKSIFGSSRSLNVVVLLSSAAFVFYLLLSVFFVHSAPYTSRIATIISHARDATEAPTSLHDVVFGIASSAGSWPKRKAFVRLWWRPSPHMRGCVFLESAPNATADDDGSLPPVCVSGDTSRFKYTYKGNGGMRSAIRVARVVSETVALNHTGVRWFVFGDDDTVFFPENLVKTLSKYDHRLWYYIGANSEIYEQNRFFSFDMAFGGAGFAISYPLAKVLASVLDSCLERYPHLYGSDARVYSCLAELGVGLSREPGFHQMDFQGDVFGYLASHPMTPLVSLHHLDYLQPIFPNRTATEAVEHLFSAVKFDSQRILQRTVCYDRWFTWSISVSWGYAVQIFQEQLFLPDILPVQQTFRQWKKGNVLAGAYNFNTKQLHKDPCFRPTVFFFDSMLEEPGDGKMRSMYKVFKPGNCSVDIDTVSPKKLEEVRVFSDKMELDIKQLKAPRRQCCDVLPSSAGKVMDIGIRECRTDELIHMYSQTR